VKLSDLLQEDVVFTDFQAGDRWQAIDELVRTLIVIGRLRPDQEESVREGLRARERISTTGLGSGVAVPHAILDPLSQVTAALAVAPDGVPFDAPDGEPAGIIFLLLVPRKSGQIQIRALSGIARLVGSPEARQALRHARVPREVLDLLREEETVEGS
jgi:mannitol/fructose-specific phosphotransferase system IIA component (Ntr-type)